MNHIDQLNYYLLVQLFFIILRWSRLEAYSKVKLNFSLPCLVSYSYLIRSDSQYLALHPVTRLYLL